MPAEATPASISVSEDLSEDLGEEDQRDHGAEQLDDEPEHGQLSPLLNESTTAQTGLFTRNRC